MICNPNGSRLHALLAASYRSFLIRLLYCSLTHSECFSFLLPHKKFQAELNGILKDYVGRANPLYFAERLTERYGTADIYLKREDLNHTGAHKINNAVGQALLAKRMGKKRIIAETGAGQHGGAVQVLNPVVDP